MRRGVAALALVGLAVRIATPAEAEPPRAPLVVELSELRSARGRVGCTLYDAPKGFPTDPSAARQRTWCGIDHAAARCAFSPIPRGIYAVACFHDEDGDGECDTNLLGIPTEGTVVSNHAKGTLGPPSFDDARFSFSGRPSALSLRMSY